MTGLCSKCALISKSALDAADRVFDILKENNPELTGEKRRTIMKPPQVCLSG